jgi:hypothetical protein
MKKFLLPVIVMAATFGTSGVYAQSKPFEGFGAYASTGYNQYKGEISGSSVRGLTIDSTTPSGAALNIGLDYTWAFGDDKRLGLAAESNLVNSSESTAASNDNGTAGSYSTKGKNYYQVSINPGFLIKKDALAYAKLGYYSVTFSITGGRDYTQDGFLFGGGIKKMMDSNWFVFGEFNARSGISANKTLSNSDGSTADIKVGGYSALFGIGTNF